MMLCPFVCAKLLSVYNNCFGGKLKQTSLSRTAGVAATATSADVTNLASVIAIACNPFYDMMSRLLDGYLLDRSRSLLLLLLLLWMRGCNTHTAQGYRHLDTQREGRQAGANTIHGGLRGRHGEMLHPRAAGSLQLRATTTLTTAEQQQKG